MQMDSGLDTGALISSRALPIRPRENAAALTDRLAAMGAETILNTLADLQRVGHLDAVAQDEAGATYARKISRDDETIDWGEPAPAIDRRVRALNPVPGAITTLDGQPINLVFRPPVPRRSARC